MKTNKTKLSIIIILISILFTLILDFTNFYKSIFSFENNPKPSINLVVLTGGTNRIKNTLDIFFSNYKKNYQLLISGAGKGFNKNTVSNLLSKNSLSKQIINCCIYIENASTNTKSNAVETIKWLKKKNVKSFTLITSNYHMPRALFEFTKISEDIIILPYVLKTKNNNIFSRYKIYFIEYIKFLITRITF